MKRLATGVVASAVAVAMVTAAIELVKPYVPVLSLGVLYVFAVLPIAVAYGLGLALVVSVASMLAFNWFHLPPVHTFTLADSSNWFALAVYLATAVVVSGLATRARGRAAAAEQRERESSLLAELATELLRGRDVDEELERSRRGRPPCSASSRR
jgi:K+-sensing histidine kinase KdpD